MTQSPEISVILPGYNEADNIDAMLAQVDAALNGVGRPFEILYVDDGSTDDSMDKLERAKARYHNLRVLRHHANFGQSAGIFSGIEAARGELVVTMDADLQNDPADLPAMLELLNHQQVDAVCGVRQKRQDKGMKIFVGLVANRVRRRALNDAITDAGCSMRVMRRGALGQLPAFRALHRFLPTIMMIHGFKVIEMPVSHRAREAGLSKYGVGNRVWVGIYDIWGLWWYRRRFLPTGRLRD